MNFKTIYHQFIINHESQPAWCGELPQHVSYLQKELMEFILLTAVSAGLTKLSLGLSLASCPGELRPLPSLPGGCWRISQPSHLLTDTGGLLVLTFSLTELTLQGPSISWWTWEPRCWPCWRGPEQNISVEALLSSTRLSLNKGCVLGLKYGSSDPSVYQYHCLQTLLVSQQHQLQRLELKQKSK